MIGFDDSFMKAGLNNMVHDPDKGIVNLDKMKEKDLLDLLVRLTQKTKSIKTRHWLRHGYILGIGKVLEKLYFMNIHRWALDDGKSGPELKKFEEYFKDKLFGDFHQSNQVIIEMMRMTSKMNKLEDK